MNRTIKIIGSVFLSLFFAANFALTAYALDSLSPVDPNYTPLTTIPGVLQKGVTTNPVQVISGVYGLAIGVGAIIAVVMIIFAGFKYMYEESIAGKSGAKEQITNAFIGLFVLLGSYILLKTVNPDLVNFDVTLSGSKTGKLAGLTAVQKESDAAATAVAQANLAIAANQKSIDTLKDVDLVAAKKAVTDMQARLEVAKKNPKSAANDAVIADLTSQLSELQTKAEGVQSQIDTKTMQNNLAIATANVSVARDNLFKNEITNLAILSQKNQNDAAIAAVDSLKTISGHTASQNTALLGNIRAAQALQVTGDAAKARSTYLTSANQDSIYLTQSKELVDAALGTINTSGFGTGVAGASTQFNQAVSQANLAIQQYKVMGRNDLADQMAKDIAKTTQILKVRQAPNCAQYSAADRQQITLCQP